MALTLEEIEHRYGIVMDIADDSERNQALLGLMDLLVTEFGVPLIEDIEWDRKHTDVLDMYRKLAISRTL